uniref:transporter substrate-binding domain-containing diguanylate cyclase n=1 Tax=Eubacterium cellulosolvens TaxID=29322 RepID=UPI0004887CFF|nr:transporter substrate-binding domain-containing protein [[Eubacterium] cellulosolvens]
MKKLRTGISAILLVLLSLCRCIPVLADQVTDTKNVVKVGYVEISNMMEGMSDDAEKSGLAYDYLQQVSYYTNWEYEYVYGDWDTILEKLYSGEIDVMAAVSKTDERKGKILFPDYAMGAENYYIYVKEDDELLSEGVNGLKGRSVSVNRNSIMESMLREWNDNGDYQIKVRTYPGSERRYEDFFNGVSDATVEADNAVLPENHLIPMTRIGSSEYYLAVAEQRTDLLRQLNEALDKIASTNPNYTKKLLDTYFPDGNVSTTLREDEQRWLVGHPEIRIGYLHDYLPFSKEDENGDVNGILIDMMKQIEESLYFGETSKFTYVGFDSSEEMLQALQDGEIDAAFPVENNVSLADRQQIYLTAELINTTMNLICKGEYRDESQLKGIAVQRGNDIQDALTQKLFPDVPIRYYDSFEEQLEAVRDGRVDAVVISDFRKDVYLNRGRYKGLTMVRLGEESSRCLAVKKGNDELLSILNRGITNLPLDYAVIDTYRYAGTALNYNFEDYILEHPFEITILGTILVAAITAMIVYIIGLHSKRRMLDEMAHKDSMTGLLNRRAYDEYTDLHDDTNGESDLMILAMDLNGLKQVNDTRGHEAGDELIIGAAQCMKSVLGRYGKVYRIGGDEFVAVVHQDKVHDGSLLQELRRTFSGWKGSKCEALYVAVGYCYGNEREDLTIKEMVRIADCRLYEEKRKFYERTGRDRRHHRATEENKQEK